MPINSTDLEIRLSGGASNAAPAASLGGVKSSVAAGSNLFDTVTGPEAAAGDVEYRIVYAHNSHATLTLENAYLWIQSNTPSTSTTVDVALGSSALNGVEPTIADENTAPVGLTFIAAATRLGGLALGNIPPGGHRAVVIRRTVLAAATAALSDPATLRLDGESAA